MIQHRILLFAGLRETARADALDVSLPETACVGDLRRVIARDHPALAPLLAHCRAAVDHTFVGDDHPLEPGMEIALIPPVSGGHDGVRPVQLSHVPLRLERLVEAVSHANAGGIATFTGNVRRHSRGLEILHLDYEAYGPMALAAMQAIVERIQAQIEGTRVVIHHRLGRLRIGESAVMIAASAAHRAEAFDACRHAIEALKEEVPIWKKEVSTDGATWIGQGP